MKHLRKFNESKDQKILKFIQKLNLLYNYDEFLPGDEPSNSDMLSEIGDLCNEFDMTSSDIKEVLDSNDVSDKFHLKIIYEETLKGEKLKAEKLNKKPIKVENCEEESKLFGEWLRHNCVISDEGYYFYDDDETYDIDSIYDIYNNS